MWQRERTVNELKEIEQENRKAPTMEIKDSEHCACLAVRRHNTKRFMETMYTVKKPVCVFAPESQYQIIEDECHAELIFKEDVMSQSKDSAS